MWWVEVVEGIVTQAPDRHEQVTKSHGPHRGEAGYRGEGHKGQRASVTWEGGGARSNAGRIQDDTNNPQNHNHNAAPNRRRQERGQMKNWKKNKTKVKINRSQPYKSDYKKKKKKAKTSTQLKVRQAAAEDKRCLIIRKENVKNLQEGDTK